MACQGCAKRKAALVNMAKAIVRTPQTAIAAIKARIAQRESR